MAKNSFKISEERGKAIEQRDELLTACEGLVEDRELREQQDEALWACQCIAEPKDGVVDYPLCNYCKAKATIAAAKKK